VLDGLEQIQLCVAYKLGDELIHYPPASVATLNKVEPVYEELPGWKSSTSDVRSFDDLPSQAQHYISRICELVGARLGIVAVGPEREQTIMVEQVF
jgi:adenylosuccinate synthase